MRKFYFSPSSSSFNSFMLSLLMVAFSVVQSLASVPVAFTAEINEETCYNVTHGGSIGSNQTGCAPFDPANIANMAWPTGGSGNIEYMWIYKNASTNFQWWEVSGANAASYNPGPLSETTMFRRCSRRQWCSTWAGESNIVTITVNQCCSNITDGGEIAADQSGCAPYDVAPLTNLETPSGGSGAIEYMWIYKNASTNWQFQTIAGALSSSYDPGVISETTVFRRCSKRSGCATWDGETGDITITINGNCIPEEECLLTGYESTNGRIFWIPNYGTDFRSSASNPLVLKKYENGAAHIVGTIERIGNTNHKFDVSLYFENESTYNEWIAMGLQAHSPNLGDESTWIYYNWATLTKNTLIGQGSLNGVVLYLTNQDGAYGLQLGNGANALNTNENGISNWFSYTGSNTGHGDLNGTYECNEPCAELCVSDNDAPVFNPFSTEVTVECVNEIPVSSVTATDACDSNVDVTYTESFLTVDADTVVCSIFDADTHTLWVSNNVKNALGVTNNNFIVDGNATFERYSDGTLKISGIVKSVSHPTKKFQFVSHFKNKRNWDEWSAIPNGTSATGFRDAKLDAGTSIIVTDEYLDWHYYEMDTSKPNELIGLGGLAGVNLQVQHAPANYEYGAQLGENASLQSYGYGFSTWITIIGNAFGNYICDAGDYNFGINNCEGEGEGEFECDDHYQIVRTYTATDNCGNTATAQQIITVLGDTEAPVFNNLPENQTVLCGNLPTGEELAVTATDNCDDNVIVTVTHVDTGEDCEITRTFTFVAEDDCGNQITAVRVFYTNDNIPPVFSNLPENAEVECGQLPNPQNFVVYAQDNCAVNPVITFTYQDAGNGCNQTRTITWTATDDCGNSIMATRVFSVEDNEIPTFINVPADMQLECGVEVENIEVLASDNCDLDVFVDHVGEIIPQECGYLFVRTWTATDDCGNIATASQTITFVDTTSPTVTYAPQNMQLECSDIIPFEEPTFSDICDDELSVSFTETQIPFGCTYKILRRWIATDDCGNEAEVLQTITVVDTTAPVLVNVPANITVTCENIPSVPTNVYAEDVCDDEIAVNFNQIINDLDCGYTITRTWSAMDDCGNDVFATQIIYVIDNIAPELLSAPENLELECTDIIPFEAPVFTDACDQNLTVTFNEYESNVNTCSYTIVRVWTATDACGNQQSFTQNILITDLTAPVISGEIDVVGYCDQTYQALVTVTDNCDNDVTLTWEDFEVSGGCEGRIIRTYTATDDCNNSSTFVQIITLTDGDAPVASNEPANLLLECTDDVPVTEVSFTDNCDDELEIVFTEESTLSDCGYTITRVWRAIDNCGNEAIVDQIITVADITNPTLFNVPASVEIECGDAIPAASTAVYATDNCTAELQVFVEEMSEALDCGTLITRVYRVFDDCGNGAMAIQTITITDTQAPVINGQVEDITVNCENIPDAPVFTAFDVCDGNVTVTFTETMGEGCPYSILRTWTATDACGNESSISQLISVIDEVNPVFDAFPVWVSVSCGEVENYTITATDNCDSDVEVTIIEELVFSGGCYGNLQRTYKATDNCGNFVTATQIIQITDNIDPVLANVPSDVTIYCESEIPAVATDVFATDNCTEEVEVFFTETQTNDFCPYDIIRTWTAIDYCGNETVATQIIHVTVEVEQQIFVNAYPNPAREEFTFEFSSPDDVQVVGGVYDVTGREVISLMRGNADGGRMYKFNVDTEALNTGTYTIRMIVDGEVYNQRMMIMGR